MLTPALLRQRLFPGVLREPARVLDASFLVVARDRVQRYFHRRLLDHVLARDLYLTVVLHAGAGGYEPAHDHVLLQAAEIVHLAVDGGFGEHARRLLETRRADERVRRE